MPEVFTMNQQQTEPDETTTEIIEVIDELIASLSLAWGKFPTWQDQQTKWKRGKEATEKAKALKTKLQWNSRQSKNSSGT